MNSIKQKSVKTLLALLAPAFFANCGQSPVAVSDPGALKKGDGLVKSSILLGKVGALTKSSTINLQKLIVTAVSSASPADTVRDTTTVNGNDAVTVLRTLTLKPLRNWIINARTLDAKDSVIHSGSTSSFFVKPSDTTAVSLNLTSKFSMYQANFNTLPDSISSTLSGTGKDKLNLNRVAALADGFEFGQNV